MAKTVMSCFLNPNFLKLIELSLPLIKHREVIEITVEVEGL